MNEIQDPKSPVRATRRGFMKTAAAAVIGAKCEAVAAPVALEAARNTMTTARDPSPYPRRVISWWSILATWNGPRRHPQKIQRRADAMPTQRLTLPSTSDFTTALTLPRTSPISRHSRTSPIPFTNAIFSS